MGGFISLVVGFFQLAWKWFILGLIAIVLISKVGTFLGPKDALQSADAIIAISGGDTQARTSAAVALYKQGLAGRLIFSGAALDPLSPSNAAVMRGLAQRQGVPPEAITIDEKARDTTQNALRSLLILHDLQAKRVILVTSGYHQRRAAMEFGHVVGSEVQIINQPTYDKDWSASWWRTPKGWWLASSEVVKIAATWLRFHLL